MTPKQKLEIVKLLSALESWGFSLRERMPDYLHEQLSSTVDLLCNEITKETEQ
jgi:hypothetical protein